MKQAAAALGLPCNLAVDAVAAYPAGERDRTAFLRLDVNEDPRGAPDHVVAALAAGLDRHAIATYPATTELRAAYARAVGCAPAEVLLCNGGDQGLELLLRAFLRPGRAVVTHAPGFDMFPLWASLHHAPVCAAPLRAEAPGHAAFDEQAWFAALQAAADGPGLGAIAIVTPNNPTGSSVSRAAIERTIAHVAALPTPVPLIVDETYIDFGGETVVDLVGRVPFLFVQRSFSKSAGLAGVRLGAVLGPAHEIDRLERAIEPYRVNRAALIAGLAALREPDGGQPPPGQLPAWWRARVAETLAGREALAAGLQALGLGVGARDANFLIAHVGDAHAEVTAALERDGILIRDRHGKHPLLDGCVRIGVGAPDQVARTLAALRKALRRRPALRAVLLDMDGTLVDVRGSCLAAIAATVRATLAADGRADAATLARVDAALVDRYKARGGLNNDWDCADAMLRDLGVHAARADIVARHQAVYRGERWDGAIASEPWIWTTQVAHALATRFAVGLVTGRPRDEALFTLARADAPLGLRPDDGGGPGFAVVVGLEDMPRQKPAPDGLLRACAAMAVAPAAVAYVGDSVDDMRAAKAAGCFAIGVLGPGEGWGQGGAERLAAAGADIVCKDIAEVVQWLEI